MLTSWYHLIAIVIKTPRYNTIWIFLILLLSYMTKFQKLRTLTGSQNSKHFFGEHTFSTRFFRSILTPRTMSNSWTRENKKVFLQNAVFHFLLFFSPFSNSTQSEFGCYIREFMHCTPPIMVSLAYSTLTVPILISKWGQNTTTCRQDLHIPQNSNFHPLFLALFLHFFSITCCKCIF